MGGKSMGYNFHAHGYMKTTDLSDLEECDYFLECFYLSKSNIQLLKLVGILNSSVQMDVGDRQCRQLQNK